MPINSQARNDADIRSRPVFKALQLCDIEAIDQALKKIGLFGEVHLVVENGRVRYVRTVCSEPIHRIRDAQAKSST